MQYNYLKITTKMTSNAQNHRTTQTNNIKGESQSSFHHQTDCKVQKHSKNGEGERQLGSEKQKKLKKKPDSIIQKLRLQKPLQFGHVINYLNMLGINERAITNNRCEEQSFYRSMFYIKTVEKVELRKHALIIHFNNPSCSPMGLNKTTVQTLVDRLLSLGHRDYYNLALQLQDTLDKYQATDFKARLAHCFQSEPLSRFIDKMHDKIYMCKVAPGKLIISRKLLELIGQDPETYALELCKFKTPRREIISNENYTYIITKSVQNLGHLCEFLNDQISYEHLQEKSTLEFTDYLLTRNYRKITCKLKLSMPNPLVHCLEAVEVGKDSSCPKTLEYATSKKRFLLDSEAKELRYRESQALRHIMKMQNNMLNENKHLVAGYMQAPNITS